MNTRAELLASLFQQYETQLEMGAKFHADGEYEEAARCIGFAHSALLKWLENKKAEEMHCTVPEASTEGLIKELRRRAKSENDETAAQALKLPLPSNKEARNAARA